MGGWNKTATSIQYNKFIGGGSSFTHVYSFPKKSWQDYLSIEVLAGNRTNNKIIQTAYISSGCLSIDS